MEKENENLRIFDASDLLKFARKFLQEDDQWIIKQYQLYLQKIDLLTRFLIDNKLEKQYEKMLERNNIDMIYVFTEWAPKYYFTGAIKNGYVQESVKLLWYEYLLDYYNTLK